MKLSFDQKYYYGILLSGGLDSAILLYLLVKHNKGIKIQPFTIPKKDGAYLYADPIIDFFNRKFNFNIPGTVKAGSPDVHHSQQNASAVKEVFQKHQIDKIFIALNPVPDALKNYPGVPHRAKESIDPRIIFPFVDFTKEKILSMLFDNGLEELISLTHSCTEQQVGRCRTCWQCQERAWAFQELKKQDCGIN